MASEIPPGIKASFENIVSEILLDYITICVNVILAYIKCVQMSWLLYEKQFIFFCHGQLITLREIQNMVRTLVIKRNHLQQL